MLTMTLFDWVQLIGVAAVALALFKYFTSPCHDDGGDGNTSET
jgi:hypothetical protein